MEPTADEHSSNKEGPTRPLINTVLWGPLGQLSTHDMGMAEQMCDSIFMIYRGKKVLDGTVASVRAAYRADTIRLKLAGGRAMLDGVDGIDRINDMGSMQEVRFSGDSQELLRRLMARTTVNHFELTEPSLHNIFIRIASPEPEDVAHV